MGIIRTNMTQASIVEGNFFVIDAENTDEVESHLYGYCIQDGKICDGRDENPEQVSQDGVYIHICRQDSRLIISQDYSGSFGLYLYQREGYFALSNSFMYLVEWLKSKEKLHVNMDYVMSMFAFDLCSLSVEETPMQEIMMLPRNARVHIDIAKKELSIERIDYQEESVSIDSEKGMAILDEWHEKWTKLIRHLKGRTNNISVDLSGGFDSRITFALFASAGINLDEVNIKSIHDDLHTHAEDYEIASDIAKYYHTKLNQDTFFKANRNFTLEEIEDISFYTKLGFHKEMYFQYRYREKPVYAFGGSGGETLREYWNMTPQDFIKWQGSLGDKYIVSEVKESAERILAHSFQTICSDYGFAKDDPRATRRLYLESRSRNHFGKAAVENYLANTIKLMPLMDKNLHMLCTADSDGGDKNYLFLLILARYADELLDFKLEGSRSFDLKTLKAVREISNKYPIKKMHHDVISFGKTSNEVTQKKEQIAKSIKYEDIHRDIISYFQSEPFRKRFLHVFSEDIYAFAQQYEKTKKFFPLKYIYSVLAAEYALRTLSIGDEPLGYALVEENETRWENSPLQLSYRSTVFKSFLSLFFQARIDLKNFGDAKNDLLFDIPEDVRIKQPQWFQKDGIGYQLESSKQYLKLSFKCCGQGILKIWLRGLDVRDSNRNAIPLYVDYTYFSINNEILLDKRTPIWHDNPFLISRHVSDGEECVIELHWEPHGVEIEELQEMIEKLLVDHEAHLNLVKMVK